MKEETIYTGRTSLPFLKKKKQAGGWTLSVQVDIQDFTNLRVLDLHRTVFKSKYDSGSDQIHDLSDRCAKLINQALPVSDRLRLAINVLDLAPAQQTSGDLYVASINCL